MANFFSINVFSVTIILFVSLFNGIRCNINQARYDNYRVYRLNIKTSEQVQLFAELEERSDSYTFYGHARHINQNLTIMVASQKIAEITELLKRYAVPFEILVDNFQAKIDAQLNTIKPINSTANDFDWDHYFHLETIYAWLDDLVLKYPKLITPLEAGKSYEGRPIKGIKLSHKINNTGVFVEGGIHAREWISPATATFILNQLLTSNDSNIQDLAQNFDWFFFPVFNPDGYKSTFEEDRMWRKTRQPFGACLGTDLNRNWQSHWNSTGSSPDQCRYDFAGSKVFSEPEAQQLAKFIAEQVKKSYIRTYISLHSFSQLLMFPYGHSAEKPRNYDDLLAIGMKGVTALQKRYGTVFETGSIHEIIYPSSGGSMDWVYETLNVPLTFTFELRGLPNSTDMFILPADQITPSGWETMDAFVSMLQEGRKRGYYNYTELVIAANAPGAASKVFGNGLHNHLFSYMILAFLIGIIMEKFH